MSHVFISYSRKDSEMVDRIVARLEAENLTVWIDREEIHGGDLWREAIVEAVDNAYAFVLMLSPYSAASDNVRKEVDLAEGAGKTLVPMLLGQSQLSARLRYQLAGIQWIEYYRDPDGKFSELVRVLRGLHQKYGTVQTAATRQVEFVFNGLDLSKLGPEERQQLQEKLLAVVATSTDTPRSDLRIVTLTAGSVHIFVDMPAQVAYQVKTAALNKDPELIRAGIDALRLAGDRDFILLRARPKTPPKSGKRGSTRGWMGGLILAVVLLLSMAAIATALAPAIFSFLSTATFTPTTTYTVTPSNTPTATNTQTPTPTPTWTFTPTSTLTATFTPSPTPSPTITPSITLTGFRSIQNSNDQIPVDRFADTTPPEIKNISLSSTSVEYGSCAHETKLNVIASVADPSGIKSVTLRYSYNRTIVTTKSMSQIFGRYVATINVGEEAYNYLGGSKGTLFVWVKAEDARGNVGPWEPGDSATVFYNECPK